MLRLILLSMASAVVFLGFAIPFVVLGAPGWLVGGSAIGVGAALVWVAERATQKSLQADSAFNRLLKTDGENLVELPRSE